MLRGLFARRAGIADPDREALVRVGDLARALLDLPDGAEVTASEIACLDPACPGTETVLLVMMPGSRTSAVKVAKAAADVTEQDLRSALVGFESGDGT